LEKTNLKNVNAEKMKIKAIERTRMWLHSTRIKVSMGSGFYDVKITYGSFKKSILY
jgi:hypothetical protein